MPKLSNSLKNNGTTELGFAHQYCIKVTGASTTVWVTFTKSVNIFDVLKVWDYSQYTRLILIDMILITRFGD